MTRWRWLARQILDGLGWQGVAGLGLTIAACAFCATVLGPLDARIAEIKAGMVLPQQARNAAANPLHVSDPAADLDAFYGSFPADDSLTDLLARLHGIGDEHGLVLQQADYRAADERGQRLGQYSIVVPAIATYPQLKRFLAAALAEIPNLSLDQISLQRRSVADSRVAVQLQFTLYLRQKT